MRKCTFGTTHFYTEPVEQSSHLDDRVLPMLTSLMTLSLMYYVHVYVDNQVSPYAPGDPAHGDDLLGTFAPHSVDVVGEGLVMDPRD